jgi:glycosyltransferase involved in cell wall biosynthesis
MPKVSIIVPCYNQAQYLDECLNSLIDQIYVNWECIIVNDGSSDNTEIIASRYLINDSRFKYVFQKNKGLSYARNSGLKFATGELILFLDSDDFLEAKKLILSVEPFQKRFDLDAVITDYNLVYGIDSRKRNPFCKLDNINFNFETIVNDWDIYFTIPIHCAVFKRSSIDKLHFNENLKAKEDWLFWIKFFKKCSNVTFINQKLVNYRRHPKSMTQSEAHMNKSQEEVMNFIKQELSVEEYEFFLLKRLKFYRKRQVEMSLKYSNLKNSLTYKFAIKLKIIIQKMYLLPYLKSILQKIQK